MEASLNVLVITALSMGLIHTAVGPDHYLPFIVLGRAEGWTVRKALTWTVLCGIGHVLSSVVLGFVGVGLGWAVSGMEWFEGIRGSAASWLLIGFGALYFLWGLWRGRAGHKHTHRHADGSVHSHAHHHAPGRAAEPGHDRRDHDEQPHVTRHRRTAWALFLIFVFGPCEPLIPLLMVPAAEHSMAGVALVAGVFGVATVGTMVAIVTLGLLGLKMVRFRALERYVHAMAGATLLVSGLATQFLGL